MKKVKKSSCKAKGRRLQNWVAQKISEITGYPWGKDQPIEPRQMGQSGSDVRLEEKVRRVFPFTVECKNQERWDIPAWIEQAKKNRYPDTYWLLIVKKNRHEPIAILDAEVFFDLMELFPR